MRGRAADAIRDLIFRSSENIPVFRRAIDHLVRDPSLAVRSCVASTLFAVMSHDVNLSLDLFDILADANVRLWGTRDANRYVYHSIPNHFARVRPYIEEMTQSGDKDTVRIGGKMAALAALYCTEAADLAKQAMAGGKDVRVGVAEVSGMNLAQAECRAWCTEHLMVLFNDSEMEVREKAAWCFNSLKNCPLEEWEPLIDAYTRSVAFEDVSNSLLAVLEEPQNRLPGITVTVCKRFLERFGPEARGIQSRYFVDAGTVSTLIFRVYHQHMQDVGACVALDLIDSLCARGISEANSALDIYER